MFFIFFFQAEDGIRDIGVTGVQTCALPISIPSPTRDTLSSASTSRRAPMAPYWSARMHSWLFPGRATTEGPSTGETPGQRCRGRGSGRWPRSTGAPASMSSGARCHVGASSAEPVATCRLSTPLTSSGDRPGCVHRPSIAAARSSTTSGSSPAEGSPRSSTPHRPGRHRRLPSRATSVTGCERGIGEWEQIAELALERGAVLTPHLYPHVAGDGRPDRPLTKRLLDVDDDEGAGQRMYMKLRRSTSRLSAASAVPRTVQLSGSATIRAEQLATTAR